MLREGREDAGELVGHSASEWLTLPRILRRDDVGRDDVFVDLGCGEGRMLLEAARRYPFKRVVGVELSGQLAAVASRNVAGHGRIEVVRSNVLDWPIPPDTSVFYLYNPFKGSVFARTVARIIASAAAHPRRIRLIYQLPREEAALLATGHFRRVRIGHSLLGARERNPNIVLYELQEKRVSEAEPSVSP